MIPEDQLFFLVNRGPWIPQKYDINHQPMKSHSRNGDHAGFSFLSHLILRTQNSQELSMNLVGGFNPFEKY